MNGVYQMIGTIWTTEKHRSLAGICRDPWSHQGMVFIKKKTIWREQTMKNHGKPLDLRALYFETKPNFHLQILQLCFFNFCRWIHSTWFCSQFPSHWTTFFRRFIIKISFECLGRHTSTMHDICSPKTGAWSVWYQMMSIPLSIPFNSCFFTDSSTYKDYNVFCFFVFFAGKWMKTKPRKPQDFMVQKPWRIIPRIISG